LLADRSQSEAVAAVGGTWIAFVCAVCLAVRQPPDLAQVAIGAFGGALLVLVGFAATSRCRERPRHAGWSRVKLAALALSAGAALGVVLLSVLGVLAAFEPQLRARFVGRLGEPAWRPWALGLESSILEEVTFRLAAMGVIAWLIGRAFGKPRAAFRAALVASTLLFGLAHIPAWLAVTRGSTALIGGVLLLNGVGGLLLGWIFWRWGLAYPLLCHLAGDVVVQGLGPRLLS
jgi:hypothetical protein